MKDEPKQPKHAPAIHTREIIQILIDAGIVPINSSRIVIDIHAGSVVQLYYSVFADERFADVLPSMLANLPVARMLDYVDKMEPKKGD